MKISVEDFVGELNWMMNDAVGALDTNDPEEMLAYQEAVASMMEENCGEIVEFEVINQKGQIALSNKE